MLKKLIGFVLKTIWIIVVLFIPTIIFFFSVYFNNAQLRDITYALRNYVPIVLIILLVLISHRSLFALSLGFLLTLATYPIGSWLLGKPYWSDLIGGFGGMGFNMAVLSMSYSFPFAFYSLLTAIIVLKIRKKLSEKGKSLFGFIQPKRTVSSGVLQPDKTNKTDDMAESETPNKTNQ